MKKIIKVTDLTELKKLYDNRAYMLEDYGPQNPEELLNAYGEDDAVGYVFTADLLYKVCNLPENSPLPRDRKYLVISSPKEALKDSVLQTLAGRIWQISFSTGYNEFEKETVHQTDVQ